ncbi:MAG: 50S ribosomal protein L24 [Nitrososphaerota archaeon]
MSSKPRKQRLRLYNAPRHRLVKLMSAHLSPQLREKYGRRSLPVRMGDTVKILSGDFKGVEGKVKAVDIRGLRVYVENVTDKKADGSNVDVPIRVSKLMITQLNLDDSYRRSKLEGGGKQG